MTPALFSLPNSVGNVASASTFELLRSFIADEHYGHWLVREGRVNPSITDTCDIGVGPNDIETATTSYDGVADEVVVEIVLCADPENKTWYRVYFDYEDTTNLDGDGNDDGPDTLDLNPHCVRTQDDRMIHRGMQDRGPGMIDVLGSTLTFRVSVDELNPFPELGDTVLIWADTKFKNVTDKAPNTETGDGCARPEVTGEVLSLELN